MIEIPRDIYKQLSAWYRRSDRKPLLLRGARQVGKSFATRAWARSSGINLIEINFEEQPRYKQLFEVDLSADRILDELSLLTGNNVRAANTILFFDEIQAAPNALIALRYFYEKTPTIAIIAAGSLIEFVLAEKGFPVGRVESLYVFPLTFSEFLAAFGKAHLRDYLLAYDPNSLATIPELVHLELLSLLRTYYRLGGMPKVVSAFLEHRDYSVASREQGVILKGYRDDFDKYAKQADWAALNAIISQMGSLVGRTRVRFSSVGKEFTATKVRRAIDLLERALIAFRVFSTHTNKLPLAVGSSQKHFKLVFLDIGLLHHLLGFDWHQISESADLTDLCEGRFAEQFVGQELLASRSGYDRYQVYYWDRPKQGSDAEVDYVIESDGAPIPLEVKSGVRGKLRSLNQYIEELKPKSAVVLSQRNCEQIENIRFLPLYLVSRLK